MAHGGGYANNNFDMIMNSSLSSINSPLLRALITPASLLNPDTNDLLYSSENSIITNHYDSGDSGGGGGVGIGGDYMTGSRSDAKIICSNADLIAFKLKDPSAVVAVIFLVIINLAVIAGNILVIVSVFVSTKLRTVTNFFIVSLAVADLLLGLTVVPYSLCLAVLDVWIFGEIWCLGWLVIDVWLSTASILNLCAISVDRYLAVTRPVRYRSIMTSKRAKLIIAFVWILSFIVSFPPILTWSQSGSILSKSGTGGGLSSIASFKTPEEPSIASTMNFGDVNSIVTAASTASSYTSSSPSSSSSYTPNLSSMEISRNPYESSNLQNLMSNILSDENNISNGNNNNNDNNNNNNNNSNDSNRYMVNGDLPQSRGSSSSSSSLPLPPTSPSPDCRWNAYQCVLFSSTGYVTYSALGSFYIPMSFMMFFYWRIYTVASRATRALKRGYKTTGRSRNENSSGGYSDERLTLRIHRGYICEGVGPNRGSNLHPLVSPMAGGSSPNHSPNLLSSSAATDCNTSFITNSSRNQSNDTSPKRIRSLLKIKRSDHRSNETGCESSINKLSDKENKKINKKLRRKKPITVYKLSSSPVAENGERLKRLSDDGSSSSPYNRDSNKSNSSKSVRFSRRTNTTGRWQTKRLLAETKAAKTVGIIVGGFIICWFPFFTIYLIRGYCQDQKCIPTLMLTIFTWLGYANSAVNPIIYGMFSRDFRRAFQNILCKCKYSEETGVTSLIRQIHLPNLFEDDNHDEMKTDSQEDIQ